ncbi:hypothetical protein D932_02804 [Enterococcus casseliflavus 14-MB-W-14]|nr:hypothetical protein D932_02804 [Enterococcus casseliflavus 14-MB-W-14]
MAFLLENLNEINKIITIFVKFFLSIISPIDEIIEKRAILLDTSPLFLFAFS